MIKEKLLAGGGGVNKDYTHIVRTDNWSDGGKDNTHSGYTMDVSGSINPQTIPSIIEPIKITCLFTELSRKQTTVTVDLPIPPYTFYLGRKEIGVVSFNGFPQNSLNIALFSEDDWGKDIYIWLSTTPPLGLRSCNKATFYLRGVA